MATRTAPSRPTPESREVSVRPLKESSKSGTKKDTVTLPGEIFGVEPNISLMHQVVVAQLAAARQGTASTKSRGEVSGGGAKPYRQKGTGRARQGSIRAPQFAGGGVVHGPKPRDYSQRTPKKMKAAALRHALSDRAANDRLHVVEGFVDGDVPSTKDALAVLTALSTNKRLLVVAGAEDHLTWKSLRNIGQVHLIEPGQLNTYDVLASDDVIFTRAALDTFLAGPVRGKRALPDLETRHLDGGVPSVAPAEGDGTVEAPTSAELDDTDESEEKK